MKDIQSQVIMANCDFKLKTKKKKHQILENKHPTIENKQKTENKQITQTIKVFVDHVEKPNPNDYESGIEKVYQNTELEKKYPDYKQGNIDKYVQLLSKKMDNSYSWKISADAQHLNIYDQDEKLFKTQKLIHIKNDTYYALFNEPSTDKIKAHKALTFVNWFM